MPFKEHGRQYDLVVFGATGYTGRLTAEHIATHLPTNLKWAVAGRTKSKLQEVVEATKKANPDRPVPDIETADTDDDTQLSALAKKTCVFITTVGPYSLYGEHVFKACAENGTHYLDVTGEFPWTVKMIRKYESTAKASGAIMVPQIGVESAPPDLSTWLLAKCLREQLGAKTKEAIISIHKLHSAPSGGTLSTVLGLFEAFSAREVAESCSPYAASPVPRQGPGLRPAKTIAQRLFGLRTVPNLGLVTSSVASSTDIPVVERSWGLLSQIPSRKKEFYGPNFTWAEFFRVRNWLHGIAVHWGLLIGGLLLIFVPPFRWLARKLVFQPGQGPDMDEAKKDVIEYRGVASPDTDVPTNKQAFSRAWFHGSMYYLTAVFLGQAALTLLEDDIGLDGGVYTPACLGQTFIDRLGEAGFKTEVKLLEN